MRMLVSTLNAASHLRTLTPLASAARAAGHDVVVAGPRGMAAEVRDDYRLDFHPVGIDWTADDASAEAIGRQLAFGAHRAYTDMLVNRVFFGEPALRAAAGIRSFAADWGADVVVRVAEEFGGYLAAEALDIPHVAVASGCTHLLRRDDIKTDLRRVRAAFGLPDDEAPDPYRHLLASFTPPGYSPEIDAITPRHYRHGQPIRRGERAPSWLADLPADRPLVLAAFGSVISGLPWKLAPIATSVLAALADLDCVAIMAAGDSAKELDVHAPEHVRVVDTIAQPLHVEAADLFLTHAGFGSVREALRAGTPMVAIPIIGDEPYHAARCADLGVATVVAPTAGAGKLRAACAEVLGEPGYRAASRRVARAMTTLPGVEQLVDDIEALTERDGETH